MTKNATTFTRIAGPAATTRSSHATQFAVNRRDRLRAKAAHAASIAEAVTRFPNGAEMDHTALSTYQQLMYRATIREVAGLMSCAAKLDACACTEEQR